MSRWSDAACDRLLRDVFQPVAMKVSGIEVVEQHDAARIDGSVFEYIARAHEAEKMRGFHGIDRVHLHPLDVQRLVAELENR